MHSLVQPNAWVALKLPSGSLRVLQVTPNTTISLGKYGSFPSNLIIHRPYHLTYELQDKRETEAYNRLRVVPAAELYSDILTPGSPTISPETATPANEDEDEEVALPTGVEYALVDPESGDVVARTDRVELDATARQTLSMEDIEALKRDGTDAGKDLIAKLMLSHTALDQKTQYSLAKYKLLKTRKYIRRFSVLPMDVPLLNHFLLEEKDPSKILDMRDEMLALLGCWANVHYGGVSGGDERLAKTESDETRNDADRHTEHVQGRYLVVDDTGGLLTAAMAERMGILYPAEKGESLEAYLEAQQNPRARVSSTSQPKPAVDNGDVAMAEAGQEPAATVTSAEAQEQEHDQHEPRPRKYPSGDGKSRGNDLSVPYTHANTLTLLHANSQPNLVFLKYYDFDITSPTQTLSHPLATNLMTLSWLQLLDPASDTTYSSEPAEVAAEEMKAWKANRRGNYHRKRRRWARIKHIVDTARTGGYSGLVVASTMDPISILRHAVPLLSGGAPIAIYSQSIEALTALVDCYSIARRAAWVADPPEDIIGKTLDEQELWAGNEEFPLNPTLLLGAAVQTSRVRRWQVLPGRTHPMMTGKGGAEGYIFTAWRVKPAEGKVEARGKGRSSKRRKVGE